MQRISAIDVGSNAAIEGEIDKPKRDSKDLLRLGDAIEVSHTRRIWSVRMKEDK